MSRNNIRQISMMGLLAFVSSCSISHSQVEKGAITGFGLLEPSNLHSDVQAINTAAGVIHTAAGVKVIQATDHVPRIRGTSFGYVFVIEGTTKGRRLDTTVTVLHPPIQTPGGPAATVQDSWTQPVFIGSPSAVWWKFDNEWEMVPGKWTIKVTHGPWLLTEKSFVVE
jgi:hypothetical protein